MTARTLETSANVIVHAVVLPVADEERACELTARPAGAGLKRAAALDSCTSIVVSWVPLKLEAVPLVGPELGLGRQFLQHWGPNHVGDDARSPFT